MIVAEKNAEETAVATKADPLRKLNKNIKLPDFFGQFYVFISIVLSGYFVCEYCSG